MHNTSFLQDLAVVMMVAGLVMVTFHALRLPVVLGYILAGVLIGPHALPSPLVTDQASIHTLSQLGVIFLLFALGLEFNYRKIRQIGLTAFIVAPLETALMFLAGHQIGHAFGWRDADCIYLGGILMISSMLVQIGINIALVAGLFLGASIVDRQDFAWLERLPEAGQPQVA